MKAIKPMKARAFIAKLLVLCMIVGLLPTVALAAQPDWVDGNTYTLTKDTTWDNTYVVGEDATGKEAPVYTVTADADVTFTMNGVTIAQNNILDVENGKGTITLHAENIQLGGAFVIGKGVVITWLSFFGDRNLVDSNKIATMALDPTAAAKLNDGDVVIQGTISKDAGTITVKSGYNLILDNATVEAPITVEAGATVTVEGKVELSADVTVEDGAYVSFESGAEITGSNAVVLEQGAEVKGDVVKGVSYTYDVNIEGKGSVTYTIDKDVETLTESGKIVVPANSKVEVEAKAETGYELKSASYTIEGGKAVDFAETGKTTLTATKGGTIDVVFEEKEPGGTETETVDYTVNITGKGSVTYTVDDDTEHAVTLTASGKVTVPVDSKVEFTAEPDTGYKLKSATYTIGTDTNLGKFVDGKATLTATKDGTIDVVFEKDSGGTTPGGGGGGNTRPTVTVKTASASNGSFTVSNQYAGAGQTVTITVSPDAGYMVDKVTVTDRNGDPVTVENLGNGKYSFVMPKSALLPVTVSVTFTAAPKFADVPADSYYAEAVEWAASLGIVAGKSDTEFVPYAGCTRGEFVTFLWRAAGTPEPTSTENPFTDVDVDEFYGKAILWAVEKKIVAGITPDTFAPDEVCLRSQAVSFIYRYEGSKKTSTAGKFTDVTADQYYADAVAWGAENGVVYGITETTFAPNDTCNRAQVVCFLYRDFVK